MDAERGVAEELGQQGAQAGLLRPRLDRRSVAHEDELCTGVAVAVVAVVAVEAVEVVKVVKVLVGTCG